MQFEVTKEWKELPYKMLSIVIPIFPAMRITASEEKPVGERGILYTGKVKEFYSGQKLWIKLPDSQEKFDSIFVEIENFI